MQYSPSRTTSLQSEERAYNTYAGGHSRSNRRARAICADGKVRTITVGIPDTYFSIPGHTRIAGKYVSGFVSVNDDGEFTFSA